MSESTIKREKEILAALEAENAVDKIGHILYGQALWQARCYRTAGFLLEFCDLDSSGRYVLEATLPEIKERLERRSEDVSLNPRDRGRASGRLSALAHLEENHPLFSENLTSWLAGYLEDMAAQLSKSTDV